MSNLTLKWGSKLLILSVETFRLVFYLLLLPFSPILYLVFKSIYKRYGITVNEPQSDPDLNLEVRDWRSWARLCAYGDLALGEGYRNGQVRGNMRTILNQLVETGFLATAMKFIKWTPHVWCVRLLWHVAERNTPESRLTACEEQYNIDDEYHRMIGGDNYDHSLPYYTKPDQTWTEAHLEKYKAFAAKMGLKEGMEVLEVGCGFGSMSKYFADTHGVKMTAITNSTGMGRTTRRRCAGSDVTVIVCDWRDISGKFDAIAVCEMAPHVGKRHLPEFFNKLHSLLKPGGKLVLQDYVPRETFPYQSSDFMNKYLYGGTFFFTISDAVKFASKHLVLKEYEDITPQYIRGLEVWVNTFEGRFDELVNYLGLKGARTMLYCWIWAEAYAKAKFWGYCHYVFVREEDLFVNKFFHDHEDYALVKYDVYKKKEKARHEIIDIC